MTTTCIPGSIAPDISEDLPVVAQDLAPSVPRSIARVEQYRDVVRKAAQVGLSWRVDGIPEVQLSHRVRGAWVHAWVFVPEEAISGIRGGGGDDEGEDVRPACPGALMASPAYRLPRLGSVTPRGDA